MKHNYLVHHFSMLFYLILIKLTVEKILIPIDFDFVKNIIPDFITWLGISMILISGLIITRKIRYNFLSLIYLKFKL